MKKIVAHWERRNLNLNVLEIEFEENDSENLLVDRINEYNNYDYVVAKIPKKRIQLIHLMENFGFRFIETQMDLFNNLNNQPPIPNYIRKISDEILIKQVADDNHLKKIIGSIDKDMFDTDRIVMDPCFDNTDVSIRYKNWIVDEYQRGSILSELQFQGEAIGFFLLKKVDPKTYFSILAGLYSNFKGLGLGFSIIERPIKWCLDNGISKLITRVSSNNLESLRLHLAFGYEIQNLHYVLRKTNKV